MPYGDFICLAISYALRFHMPCDFICLAISYALRFHMPHHITQRDTTYTTTIVITT